MTTIHTEVTYQPSKQSMTDGELSFDHKTLEVVTIALLRSQTFFTYRAAEIFSQSVKLVHTVDFSHNTIGDIGAVALSKIPTLRTLKVSQCDIGDEGATALFNHTGLHQLSIDGNTISPQVLATLNDNNALQSLKINCSKQHIEPLSRCALKHFEPQFDQSVTADEQTALQDCVARNRAQCDQFIRSTTEMLLLAKYKAPLFKAIPADIIKDICFALGRHLPKTPIQIACCIILLDDRVNNHSQATSLTVDQKGLAWTLVARHMEIQPEPLPPEQYIDELPLKIFSHT